MATLRTVRKHKLWCLDRVIAGVRRREFFASKAEALAAELSTRGEVVGWDALTPAERDELASVWVLAERHGLSLREVLNDYLDRRKISTCTLGESIDAFMLEKQAQQLSHKTMAALRSNLGRFRMGRDMLLLHQVRRDEVVRWLPADKPHSFNSQLTSLKTFFAWCVAGERIAESPVAKIKKVGRHQLRRTAKPPAILSIDQCKLLLTAASGDRDVLRVVVLGLFAGLRPEREARAVVKSDVADGRVFVSGAHAKDAQSRYVPAHPTLLTWLERASWDPLVNFRRRFERVRAEAGLIRLEDSGGERPKVIATGWAQDILRHTFAGHYMPLHGADATREALGHGDFDMLFGHYRRLVTKEQAELFWLLRPEDGP